MPDSTPPPADQPPAGASDPGRAPAPPPPTPPAGPSLVPIPVEQLQRLLSLETRLNDLTAAQQHALKVEQDKAAQALLAKGQAEEAVRQIKQQHEAELNTVKGSLTATEQRAKNYAIDRELTAALASAGVIPDLIPDLTAILRPGLDAAPEGGGYAVRTQTFQSATDYVKEYLSKPGRDSFLPAANRGGGGQPPANRAAPTPQPGDRPPGEPPPFADFLAGLREAAPVRANPFKN